MDVKDFKVFIHDINSSLSRLLYRYTQALFHQLAQHAACNSLHDIYTRCARWLLMTHDRVTADTFPLTHEFLSQMLAVRRASVTEMASRLQEAGLSGMKMELWKFVTEKDWRKQHANITP